MSSEQASSLLQWLKRTYNSNNPPFEKWKVGQEDVEMNILYRGRASIIHDLRTSFKRNMVGIFDTVEYLWTCQDKHAIIYFDNAVFIKNLRLPPNWNFVGCITKDNTYTTNRSPNLIRYLSLKNNKFDFGADARYVFKQALQAPNVLEVGKQIASTMVKVGKQLAPTMGEVGTPAVLSTQLFGQSFGVASTSFIIAKKYGPTLLNKIVSGISRLQKNTRALKDRDKVLEVKQQPTLSAIYNMLRKIPAIYTILENENINQLSELGIGEAFINDIWIRNATSLPSHLNFVPNKTLALCRRRPREFYVIQKEDNKWIRNTQVELNPKRYKTFYNDMFEEIVEAYLYWTDIPEESFVDFYITKKLKSLLNLIYKNDGGTQAIEKDPEWMLYAYQLCRVLSTDARCITPKVSILAGGTNTPPNQDTSDEMKVNEHPALSDLFTSSDEEDEDDGDEATTQENLEPTQKELQQQEQNTILQAQPQQTQTQLKNKQKELQQQAKLDEIEQTLNEIREKLGVKRDANSTEKLDAMKRKGCHFNMRTILTLAIYIGFIFMILQFLRSFADLKMWYDLKPQIDAVPEKIRQTFKIDGQSYNVTGQDNLKLVDKLFNKINKQKEELNDTVTQFEQFTVPTLDYDGKSFAYWQQATDTAMGFTHNTTMDNDGMLYTDPMDSGTFLTMFEQVKGATKDNKTVFFMQSETAKQFVTTTTYKSFMLEGLYEDYTDFFQVYYMLDDLYNNLGTLDSSVDAYNLRVGIEALYQTAKMGYDFIHFYVSTTDPKEKDNLNVRIRDTFGHLHKSEQSQKQFEKLGDDFEKDLSKIVGSSNYLSHYSPLDEKIRNEDALYMSICFQDKECFKPILANALLRKEVFKDNIVPKLKAKDVEDANIHKLQHAANTFRDYVVYRREFNMDACDVCNSRTLNETEVKAMVFYQDWYIFDDHFLSPNEHTTPITKNFSGGMKNMLAVCMGALFMAQPCISQSNVDYDEQARQVSARQAKIKEDQDAFTKDLKKLPDVIESLKGICEDNEMLSEQILTNLNTAKQNVSKCIKYDVEKVWDVSNYKKICRNAYEYNDLGGLFQTCMEPEIKRFAQTLNAIFEKMHERHPNLSEEAKAIREKIHEIIAIPDLVFTEPRDYKFEELVENLQKEYDNLYESYRGSSKEDIEGKIGKRPSLTNIQIPNLNINSTTVQPDYYIVPNEPTTGTDNSTTPVPEINTTSLNETQPDSSELVVEDGYKDVNTNFDNATYYPVGDNDNDPLKSYYNEPTTGINTSTPNIDTEPTTGTDTSINNQIEQCAKTLRKYFNQMYAKNEKQILTVEGAIDIKQKIDDIISDPTLVLTDSNYNLNNMLNNLQNQYDNLYQAYKGSAKEYIEGRIGPKLTNIEIPNIPTPSDDTSLEALKSNMYWLGEVFENQTENAYGLASSTALELQTQAENAYELASNAAFQLRNQAEKAVDNVHGYASWLYGDDQPVPSTTSSGKTPVPAPAPNPTFSGETPVPTQRNKIVEFFNREATPKNMTEFVEYCQSQPGGSVEDLQNVYEFVKFETEIISSVLPPFTPDHVVKQLQTLQDLEIELGDSLSKYNSNLNSEDAGLRTMEYLKLQSIVKGIKQSESLDVVQKARRSMIDKLRQNIHTMYLALLGWDDTQFDSNIETSQALERMSQICSNYTIIFSELDDELTETMWMSYNDEDKTYKNLLDNATSCIDEYRTNLNDTQTQQFNSWYAQRFDECDNAQHNCDLLKKLLGSRPTWFERYWPYLTQIVDKTTLGYVVAGILAYGKFGVDKVPLAMSLTHVGTYVIPYIAEEMASASTWLQTIGTIGSGLFSVSPFLVYFTSELLPSPQAQTEFEYNHYLGPNGASFWRAMNNKYLTTWKNKVYQMKKRTRIQHPTKNSLVPLLEMCQRYFYFSPSNKSVQILINGEDNGSRAVQCYLDYTRNILYPQNRDITHKYLFEEKMIVVLSGDTIPLVLQDSEGKIRFFAKGYKEGQNYVAMYQHKLDHTMNQWTKSEARQDILKILGEQKFVRNLEKGVGINFNCSLTNEQANLTINTPNYTELRHYFETYQHFIYTRVNEENRMFLASTNPTALRGFDESRRHQARTARTARAATPQRLVNFIAYSESDDDDLPDLGESPNIGDRNINPETRIVSMVKDKRTGEPTFRGLEDLPGNSRAEWERYSDHIEDGYRRN